MADSQESAPGIFGSLRRLLDTLLATAQNRVELIALELQEEKCRLVELFLWMSAVVALGMMSLAMVTLTIVVLFWNNGRLAALITLSALYLLATAGAYWGLNTRLRKGNLPFSGTVSELKKDRECLRN